MTLSCWKLSQSWPATIYLWSKVVCFVLYLRDPANQDASARVFGLFGKFSTRRGASAWVHNVWTCGAKKFLNIEWFLHWKLNWIIAANFGGIGMCLRCCLERSGWARFNRTYLVRFGFRMWQILIFNWFLPLKIQLNSKKPGFGREKISQGRGNTWANGTGHTSMNHFYYHSTLAASTLNMLFSQKNILWVSAFHNEI